MNLASLTHATRALLVVLCLSLVALAQKGSPTLAADPALNEATSQTRLYQIKAAFLYNFAILAEWPLTGIYAADSQFRICILGPHPISRSLDALVGKKVKGRKIAVLKNVDLHQALRCQIVYLGGDAHGNNEKTVLQRLGREAVMTVSDEPHFPRRGGIIGFTVVKNRLRFEINLSAAKRAKITLRSRLLRLGKIVAPENRAVMELK